jgi:DTW domain-containing protein YfiP
LCGEVVPIDNEVGVHVLQHPREGRHPLGTARLLRLGLTAVRIHRLGLRGRSAVSPPIELPERSALLYPSSDARDLAELGSEERPPHLVVIDGTWTQTKRILRDNPWISGLPRYRIADPRPSRYRIRAEPRRECLSTVETVVEALRQLQPGLRGTESLLWAFESMIDAQIEAAAGSAEEPPRRRLRRRRPKPLADPLLFDPSRIVIVYLEFARAERGDSEQRIPLRVSAVDLEGNRAFDRCVRSRPPPDDHLADQMGLDAQAQAAAEPYQEVMRAFLAFLRRAGSGADPSVATAEAQARRGPPVLVSWNRRTQHWLKATTGDAQCLLLKGVWANLSRERVPALETLVDALGLQPERVPVTGRAGRRLACCRAMTRHILAHAP